LTTKFLNLSSAKGFLGVLPNSQCFIYQVCIAQLTGCGKALVTDVESDLTLCDAATSHTGIKTNYYSQTSTQFHLYRNVVPVGPSYPQNSSPIQCWVGNPSSSLLPSFIGAQKSSTGFCSLFLYGQIQGWREGWTPLPLKSTKEFYSPWCCALRKRAFTIRPFCGPLFCHSTVVKFTSSLLQ